MKFRVTGGPEGDRGLDAGGRRYEPGDVIELTQQKAAWLVDKGLLEPEGKASGKAQYDPAPEPADPVDDLVDEDDLDEEID
jgi:hypothetical protein